MSRLFVALTVLFFSACSAAMPLADSEPCSEAGRIDVDEVNWADLRDEIYADSTRDVGLTDAYVRSVFREGRVTEYQRAAMLYEDVLLDAEASGESETRECHWAQLRLITPDSIQAGAAAPSVWLDEARRWLRAQDPIPSTQISERAVEHLRRVATAEKEFSDLDQPAGVDVRGETHIQLGPPTQITSIQFNSSRVLQIIRGSPTLSRGDFPKNQYWVYKDLGEYAQYIFLKDGKTWSTGTVLDLIPSSFRSGMGSNRRGRQRATELSILLQEIYAQFSTINIDYATLYQESADVAAPTLSAGSRTSRIRQLVSRGRSYDRERAYRRDSEVPKQVAQERSAKDFPVNVRVARFLTEEGRTRVEVYWGLSPETVDVLSPSVLRQTAVQYDDAYRPDTARTREYTLAPRRNDRKDQTIIAPVVSTVIDGDGRYHLALQWDQFVQETGLESAARRTVYRVDSLRTLARDQSALEMSDLKVTFVPPSPQTASVDDLRANPFPYVGPSQGFGVYFEVYNLVYGEDDQTRYEVEYLFRKRSKDGDWVRLRPGVQTMTTATQATYSGTSRRTEEFIVVEPERLDAGNDEQLEFLVRVTDLVTSQVVERSVRFDYTDPTENSSSVHHNLSLPTQTQTRHYGIAPPILPDVLFCPAECVAHWCRAASHSV